MQIQFNNARFFLSVVSLDDGVLMEEEDLDEQDGGMLNCKPKKISFYNRVSGNIEVLNFNL